MAVPWEPRGLGCPIQHADFHSHHDLVPRSRSPLISTTPEVKPGLLLVWQKGPGGLVVFAVFPPTLSLQLHSSDPCLQRGLSLGTDQRASGWLPTLAHFLTKTRE